jgi:hypothetical protein
MHPLRSKPAVRSATFEGIVEAMWRLGLPPTAALATIAEITDAQAAATALEAPVGGPGASSKSNRRDQPSDVPEDAAPELGPDTRVAVAEITPTAAVVAAAAPAVALLRKTLRAGPGGGWAVVRGSLPSVPGLGPAGLPMLCVRHFAVPAPVGDEAITVRRVGPPPVPLQSTSAADEGKGGRRKGKK